MVHACHLTSKIPNFKSQISNPFFFNGPASTEIYTLSLHDALPIWRIAAYIRVLQLSENATLDDVPADKRDRKSTRLNSSHSSISYAVFCLKKKTELSKVLGKKLLAPCEAGQLLLWDMLAACRLSSR